MARGSRQSGHGRHRNQDMGQPACRRGRGAGPAGMQGCDRGACWVRYAALALRPHLGSEAAGVLVAGGQQHVAWRAAGRSGGGSSVSTAGGHSGGDSRTGGALHRRVRMPAACLNHRSGRWEAGVTTTHPRTHRPSGRRAARRCGAGTAAPPRSPAASAGRREGEGCRQGGGGWPVVQPRGCPCKFALCDACPCCCCRRLLLQGLP